jgi:hypothetical protein
VKSEELLIWVALPEQEQVLSFIIPALVAVVVTKLAAVVVAVAAIKLVVVAGITMLQMAAAAAAVAVLVLSMLLAPQTQQAQLDLEQPSLIRQIQVMHLTAPPLQVLVELVEILLAQMARPAVVAALLFAIKNVLL